MQLRTAGLRVTRPRLSVLGALERLGGHRAAEEIASALREHGEPLPRSTLYNVLDDLTRAGLALRAEVGPGRELYEAAAEWHHHLVCRLCESVIDVACVVGERPCLEAGLPGARIERAEVIFRGICPACARG